MNWKVVSALVHSNGDQWQFSPTQSELDACTCRVFFMRKRWTSTDIKLCLENYYRSQLPGTGVGILPQWILYRFNSVFSTKRSQNTAKKLTKSKLPDRHVLVHRNSSRKDHSWYLRSVSSCLSESGMYGSKWSLTRTQTPDTEASCSIDTGRRPGKPLCCDGLLLITHSQSIPSTFTHT